MAWSWGGAGMGAGGGAAAGALAGSIIPGVGTLAGGLIGGYLGGGAGGLMGGKKKKGLEMYYPPKYQGERPWMPAQIGYGADTMKGLSDAYLPALKERAFGGGQVGFDPRYSEMKKQNLNADLSEQRRRDTEQMQGQSSGQGLRGGIPMSIGERYMTDFQRNRQNSLNNIDIADLQARREDINKAFYQLPEEVTRGQGFQNDRSSFDFGVYNAEQPSIIQRDPSTLMPALAGAAGSLGSAYMNNRGQKDLMAQLLATQGGGANQSLSGGNMSSYENLIQEILRNQRSLSTRA